MCCSGPASFPRSGDVQRELESGNFPYGEGCAAARPASLPRAGDVQRVINRQLSQGGMCSGCDLVGCSGYCGVLCWYVGVKVAVVELACFRNQLAVVVDNTEVVHLGGHCR